MLKDMTLLINAAACARAIAEKDHPPGAGADEATSDKKLDISAMLYPQKKVKRQKPP